MPQTPSAPSPRPGSPIIGILVWVNILHWPALLIFQVVFLRVFELDPWGREAWTLVGTYLASTAALYITFLAQAIAGRLWIHHPKAFRWFLMFPPFVFFYFLAGRKHAWRFAPSDLVRAHVELEDRARQDKAPNDK